MGSDPTAAASDALVVTKTTALATPLSMVGNATGRSRGLGSGGGGDEEQHRTREFCTCTPSPTPTHLPPFLGEAFGGCAGLVDVGVDRESFGEAVPPSPENSWPCSCANVAALPSRGLVSESEASATGRAAGERKESGWTCEEL
jgi:hypothetical protein